MSFLQGLGSALGGFDSTFGPQLEQYKKNQATGQGVAAMMGDPAPQQSALGSLMQGTPLASLLSGGGQSTVPNVPVQAQPTQFGQGGTAQSPMPQPVAIPPLTGGQPMNNPSVGQAAPVTPPSAGSLQQGSVGQAGQQPAQISGELQGQQSKPQDLSQWDGQFDFNHLLQNVVRTNTRPNGTVNYANIGRIANSPAFERMLTQQGLNQYRALNLGLRQEGYDIKQKEFGQRESDVSSREKRLGSQFEQGAAWRKQALTAQVQASAINKDAQSRIAQINASVLRGDVTPEQAQKQIQAIVDDREKKIGEIIKGINEPPDMKDDSSSSAGDPLEEAKAAIAAGRNKQMVIDRFKKLHPDLDASGL